MIKFNDLKNKVYSNKDCIQFECDITSGVDKDDVITARFFKRKYMDFQTQWVMQIVIDRTRDKDSEVYNFGYVMPKENLPLELIAATGLRYFQLHLKEEIQVKSNLDFILGEIIRGM